MPPLPPARLPDARSPWVLVADDNPTNQLVARHMLTRLGYAVTVVDDGNKVLAEVARRRYLAVLMDIEMPGLDGFAATAALRASLLPADQPFIIALTANALTGERERCLAAGTDEYLSKPVQLEALQAALLRAAARVELAAPAHKPAEPAELIAAEPWQRLLQVVDGDRESLREIIGSYLESSAELVATLTRAAAARDLALLRRTAHGLRGSAAMFGALQLAQRCSDLEDAAQHGPGRIDAVLTALREQHTQVCAWLSERLPPP